MYRIQLGMIAFFVIVPLAVIAAHTDMQGTGERAECLPNTSLHGRLQQPYEKNAKYLIRLYRDYRDFMYAPFAKRGQRKGAKAGWLGEYQLRQWDGEYAFKWLDAACLIAKNTSHQVLQQKTDLLADVLIKMQQSDGYMGIEEESNKGQSPWEIWNHWYAITGWLTKYQCSGDKRCLHAAEKAGKWVMSTYGPIANSSSEFYKGAHNGGCNVDIIDQLVRLYDITNNPTYIRFVEDVIEHYPPLRQMRDTRTPVLTHAYVILAYLGGVTEYARVVGDSEEIEWIECVWEDLFENHLYPTGSLGFDERLRKDAPNDKPVRGNVNWRNHQETCATVEWMIFNKRLYEATGDVRYMHAIENTIYNALMAAQSMGSAQWMYYTPLRYEKKWFNGPTRCCYFSGPRGIALLASMVYATDEEGLIVNLFEDSRATFNIAGCPVNVRQQTLFPSEGRSSISFRLLKPLPFSVKLRIPKWAKNFSVSINEQSLQMGAIAPGRYYEIRRTWERTDSLEVEFTIPTHLKIMKDHGYVLVRGAEVLAVNESDNSCIELDNVSLSGKSVAQISPVPGTSPRRYQTTVHIAQAAKLIRLIPFAYAGNYSRYRTVFPLHTGDSNNAP